MGEIMSQIRRICLVLLLGLGLVLGVTSPASALLNAQPDGSQHPYVGVIFNDQEFCTASAVGPRLLVTASHCLAGGTSFSASFAAQPAKTSAGWPDSTAPTVIHGSAIDVTDYCGLTGTCGPGLPGFADPDIAVVVLDNSLSLSRYASLPQPGLVNTLAPSQAVTLVGYGVNTIQNGGGTPRFAFDLTRRTVAGKLLPFGAKLESDFVKYQVKGGSAGMCFGDSGGPVLLGDTIIGVNSFINGMCSSFDGATRMDTPAILASIRSFA
jgi:hypothetical protein